jgi:diacylglycerol kinase
MTRLRPSERLASFGNALRGLRAVMAQPNAWIHAAATLAVAALAVLLRVPRDGVLWLVAAVALVWTAEALNTALEQLADAVHPEHHPLVGRAKDVAAGAVLLAATGAAVIGLLVLGPPLLALLGELARAG